MITFFQLANMVGLANMVDATQDVGWAGWGDDHSSANEQRTTAKPKKKKTAPFHSSQTNVCFVVAKD